MNSSRLLELDFIDFLKELLNLKCFSDSKEEGIVKFTIEHGYKSLSAKQDYVFLKAIKPFIIETCSRCGEEIPWCEMLAANDNGRECSWCQQVGHKDE